MAKILITGGTGLIGKTISDMLLKNGDTPVLLGRGDGLVNGIKKYKWDLTTNYVDPGAFENVEHIIHLAGAGIVDNRWTESYKLEILKSRVKSSELLYNHLVKNNVVIKSMVGASAVGYYGGRQSNHVFTEEDSSFDDFLGKTCQLWEQSYSPFEKMGIRTSIIRTGIVLSARGGAYKVMAKAFKLGLGAPVASGKQYIPWIHIHDIASMFIYALLNEQVKGIFNGVASEFVSNDVFSKKLAQSLHKPFFLPNVPAFMLKIVLGESAVTITEGLKISNKKIKNTGFKFQYEHLEMALKNVADDQ